MNKQRIVVVGASGFLGRHIAEQLIRDGHHVSGTARHIDNPALNPDVQWHAASMQHTTQAQWLALLQDHDTVVNAVGILRERPGQTFADVHIDGPRRLFNAAKMAGINRIVHVSALGAAEDADSAYHRSKFSGEQALHDSGVSWAVLRPSLVYGRGGDSTEMFRKLARLPVIPLIWGGRQQVQPLLVTELAELVSILIKTDAPSQLTLAAVGPQAIDMRHYYTLVRQSLTTKKARFFSTPKALLRLGAWVGDFIPGSPLCRDTFIMLYQHNIAPSEPAAQLLGRTLASPTAFIGDS